MEWENSKFSNIYIIQILRWIDSIILKKNCSKRIIVGCCEGRAVQNFEVQIYTLFQKCRYFNHLKALMNEIYCDI